MSAKNSNGNKLPLPETILVSLELGYKLKIVFLIL